MSRMWWMLAAIAFAACSDDPARSESEAPAAHLVTRTDPATAADCPTGGSVVRSGYDANGNGVLDDAEVATRTVVCDVPPGPPAQLVVRLVAEPAGHGHCDRDGTAVQTGHDRNGNGALDDAEVEHTDFLCGEPLRSRLVAEPAGARCIAGGVLFQAGPDRDGNGKLDDGEVEQTEVSCGDVVTRTVAIGSADDVMALAGIAVIDGSLLVEGAPISDLTLPKLIALRGALEVRDTSQLASVALPVLSELDSLGDIRNNAALAHLRLPALHAGDLDVIDNPHLPACEVEALFAAMTGTHHQSGNDDSAECGP